MRERLLFRAFSLSVNPNLVDRIRQIDFKHLFFIKLHLFLAYARASDLVSDLEVEALVAFHAVVFLGPYALAALSLEFCRTCLASFREYVAVAVNLMLWILTYVALQVAFLPRILLKEPNIAKGALIGAVN